MNQLELSYSTSEESKKPSQPVALPDIQALTQQAKELLVAAGCAPLAERIRVEWKRGLRTTAGLAYYAETLVCLNPRIASFGAEEIDKTLRHELGHLVARYRAGRKRIAPHGREWKLACADLGLPDEKRCHNLPLPRRRVARKHLYRCNSCHVQVARVRPFRRKVACLACCRAFSRGQYDDRFRLIKIALPQ